MPRMPFLCMLMMVMVAPVAVAEDTLDRVARQVADQIKEDPGDIASLYSKPVLQQISEAQLKSLYSGFYQQHGKVISVVAVQRGAKSNGKYTFSFEKGVQMTVSLAISTNKPVKVTGVFFSPPTRSYSGISTALSDLKALPGTVSFQLAKLSGSDIEVMHAINADSALGIGSTFKLYILAAMLQEKSDWDRVIKLKNKYMSLPSGRFHTWPAGSPMTLHTLATAMISESDNTATDHLLFEVGRKKVEAMLPVTGNEHVSRNQPFLSTMEMFKLKSDDRLLDKYVKGDTDRRRKLLRGSVKRVKRDGVEPFADGKPVAIDEVEWFASAADLCRLLKWLHDHDDGVVLPILSVNKGLDISDEAYSYAGYKGGSEPGVLNMTWLLKDKSGQAYVLSAGWNNPTEEGAPIEKFVSILQPILDLLGRGEAN
ncbi:MAG: serine hydrolase [Phycisphaerae bacterium]